MVGLIHELFMTSTLNLALLLLCLSATLNGAAETPQSPPSNATPEHPKTSMQLKVDHAGICSYQLEPLQQAFADIGLKTEYGARMPPAELTMHCWASMMALTLS
jgi:hypothetical protein